MKLPIQGKKKPMNLPLSLSKFIGSRIHNYQKKHPNQPVDLWYLPLETRLLIKGISMYDPDFSRACIDGSMQQGFNDHADALAKITCPVLLLQANWFRDEKYGLVGAMDDKDVERTRSLVRDFSYRYIATGHVIHLEKSKLFINEVLKFTKKIGC